MRLLIEIVIVAALIYLGWNRPFKEWAAQGSAMATSRIHAPAWEDHSSTPTPPAAKRNPRWSDAHLSKWEWTLIATRSEGRRVKPRRSLARTPCSSARSQQ